MPTKKTSTKVLRDRHPITCNLTDAQYREVQAAITVTLRRTGIDLKPGTYATHALLSYPRHRAAIDLLENMIKHATALGEHAVSIESIKAALSAVQA